MQKQTAIQRHSKIIWLENWQQIQYCTQSFQRKLKIQHKNRYYEAETNGHSINSKSANALYLRSHDLKTDRKTSSEQKAPIENYSLDVGSQRSLCKLISFPFKFDDLSPFFFSKAPDFLGKSVNFQKRKERAKNHSFWRQT